MEMTKKIEDFCSENGFQVIGKIPFDPKIVHALREFKTPIDAGLTNITLEMESIWEKISEQVSNNTKN